MLHFVDYVIIIIVIKIFKGEFKINIFFWLLTLIIVVYIIAEKVPSISREKREKWLIEDGTTKTEIKFNLPTDFAEIFPPENGEIIAYQIYVIGKSSNEDIRKSKLSCISCRHIKNLTALSWQLYKMV